MMFKMVLDSEIDSDRDKKKYKQTHCKSCRTWVYLQTATSGDR